MDKIKVMAIFGTRPEAIKMAGVVKALEKNEDIDSYVLVSAQHRQMLDSVMDIFSMKADFDLDIMQKKQTISQITTKVLNGVFEILDKKLKPDAVLVHGDTTTAFSAALAAFYSKVPVCHVEAGLRTGNIYSPYPEEMNRRLITELASVNYAPTENNKANLLKENVKEDQIVVTGNTVIDALHMVIEDNYEFEDKRLSAMDKSKKNILLTCHRRENWGEPMEDIFKAVAMIADKYKDINIIYPVHPNPSIVELAGKMLTRENILLIQPLEYKEFANLISKVSFVMTDSGGLQEEAPSLGKPVLVLRTETERPEAVKAGTVKIVGVKTKDVFEYAQRLIEDEEFYSKMSKAVNPYGDGKASGRIAEDIAKRFAKEN